MKFSLSQARPAFGIGRILLICLMAFMNVVGQPTLTTIQDTVYLADGKRFNGLALIDWKTFDSPNGAVIGQFSKTTRIVDGVLRVQLAPTTGSTKAYYSVRYSSEGRVVFSEVWAVGATTNVLRLRDVRAVLLPGGYVSPSSSSPDGGGSSGGGTPPPVIGADSSGAFVDAETPAGAVDGSNVSFTLASTPSPSNTLSLYLNGLQLSATVDYTISSATITFINGLVPQPGDVIRAYYRTGAIPAAAHSLLSATHSDTATATATRGDLITGQFGLNGPVWNRLALGTANQCLVSNGTDAVWNSCLVTGTGFSNGNIPYTTSGRLAADSLFNWDATNRRLGLGTSSPTSNLTIRALSSQGSANLTAWQNSGATRELARVDANGNIGGNRFEVLLTADTTTAGFRDRSLSNDPGTKQNGDFWFIGPQSIRKTYEANQVHALPQVICSSGGPDETSASTSYLGPTTPKVFGNCRIPASFIDAGDRLEVIMTVEHRGTAAGFAASIASGANQVWSQTYSSSTSLLTVRASTGVFTTGLSWGVMAFTNSGAFEARAANSTQTVTSEFVISFSLNLTVAATSDYVVLRNYTVVRYPGQFNGCISPSCSLTGAFIP